MQTITKTHITLALIISVLISFFAYVSLFIDASDTGGSCVSLSSALSQMADDELIGEYIDPECQIVELLVQKQNIGGTTIKCVTETRPGNCEIDGRVVDDIVDRVEDIINDATVDSSTDLSEDEIELIVEEKVEEVKDETVEELVEDVKDSIDKVEDDVDEIIIVDQDFLADITPPIPDVKVVEEEAAVIGIEYLDDVTIIEADDQDISLDLITQSTDQEQDIQNAVSVMDEIYTTPEISDRIVDGTIFLRSSDPDKLAAVQKKLEERFGDEIQSVGPLFPETGLLDDVVVDFDVDELTYLEIVEFLDTEGIFTEYALDTDTNTAIELMPNIKFSSRGDLVNRENTGAYDIYDRDPANEVDLVIQKDGTVIPIPRPTADMDAGDLENLPYNDATAIIKRQEHLAGIGFEKIEACLDGGVAVQVAVIDNGFDITHEDLQGNVTVTVDVADEDDNVQVPKIAKERNHGTKEAGLIGATHNEYGVRGVTPTSELVLIKATKDTEHGADITHGIEALAAAYEQGATVINMSWGGFGDVPMLKRVSEEIASKGVQLVAAAGNYNKNEPFFPAAYERVIGVAAIDDQGNKAEFSNYGDRVDISAPGTNIMTTDLANTYNRYSGTSEAAPLVAGSIALLQSVLLEASEIESRLAATQQFGIGAGLLDVSFLCDEGLIDREAVKSSEGYVPLVQDTWYVQLYQDTADVLGDIPNKLFAAILPQSLHETVFSTQGADISTTEKNLIRFLLILLLLCVLGVAVYIVYDKSIKSTTKHD